MIDTNAANIVRDFAQRFCCVDDSLTDSMEKNYKNCYKLAEEWAQGVRNWLDPEQGDSLAITTTQTALKATQTVCDLIKAGNQCREDYFRLITDAPRDSLPTFTYLSKELRDNYLKWNKIKSIKRVRELTRCGLKEAKDFVEAFAITDETLSRNILIKDVIT